MAFSLEALILTLPGLIVALSFHEFAHALVADVLGDPTPRRAGRLTLEPWAHLDPVGTLLLLFYRFGWARPVPVNPYNFQNPRRGMLWVALAGPAANIIVAFVLGLALVATISLAPATGMWQTIVEMLRAGLFINVALAIFNLLPVPPLDGSRILGGVLPRGLAQRLADVEHLGPILLVILLMTGVGGRLIAPAVYWLQRTIVLVALGLLAWL
ncbi:MAG: site-2 protease family protein [Bacillota bacterium]